MTGKDEKIVKQVIAQEAGKRRDTHQLQHDHGQRLADFPDSSQVPSPNTHGIPRA
jgi:hypothetical protein